MTSPEFFPLNKQFPSMLAMLIWLITIELECNDLAVKSLYGVVMS